MENSKVQKAIERFKAFEPDEGYYIDDYTIEDGSIVFYIDGVKYHLTDYSVRRIEK